MENLELRGSWYGVHQNLGVAFQKLGQKQAAIEHYEKALEHDPNLVRVRKRLRALRGG